MVTARRTANHADRPSRFREQVRLGEDSGLEFKQARFQGDRVNAPHRDGLADVFAAFANSDGGRVVLGITDDRTQQALTSVQLDLLSNLVTEICSDSKNLRWTSASIGSRRLRVAVSCWSTYQRARPSIAPRAVTFDDGETPSVRCSLNEIGKLLQSRGHSDATATDSQVVRNTGVNSLSPDLWRRYASSRTNDPAGHPRAVDLPQQDLL